MVVDTKQCTGCSEVQPLEEFYFIPSRQRRHTRCRRCMRAANKRWQDQNPDAAGRYREKAKADGRMAQRNRRTRLKALYGLTPEQFDALLAAQGGGCAICGVPLVVASPGQPGWQPEGACVDHDHTTGQVRGILCGPHNLLLGYAADDPDMLIKASEYLRKHAEIRGAES